MFEGLSPEEEHDIVLPSGEKLAVTGVRRGPIESPTISGKDSEGNKIDVTLDTIDGELHVTSYAVNGEEQPLDIPPLAA